jgi:hypothetical protein
MVSEDSQDLGRFPMIHRLSDLSDLDEARPRQVLPLTPQIDDSYELFEVFPLRRSQRMFTEDWDDYIPQVHKPTDVVPVEILPVIIASTIHVHLAAPKEAAQLFQDRTTAGAPHNHEGWLDLPAHRHASVAKDRTAEIALSIDETDDPSLVQESFLLVFRISHFVTAVHGEVTQRGCITPREQRVVENSPGFPAYSRLLSASSPARGAAPLSC